MSIAKLQELMYNQDRNRWGRVFLTPIIKKTLR